MRRRFSVDGLRRRTSSFREHLSPLRRYSSQSEVDTMHFSWQSGRARLVITADTRHFDQETIQHFKDEGFEVAYLPYNGVDREYNSQLQMLEDPLELGEKYAIVAYGEAAALVLEACTKPMPKLCAVVAYYPPRIPQPTGDFPSQLNIKIHLAGMQQFSGKHNCHTYVHAKSGFAELDSPEYDEISARLAWSRTLACLRQGFEIYRDIEPVWERHVNMIYTAKDVKGAMQTMTEDSYVNFIPTMTGGYGSDELSRFYADYFIPGNPPSLKMRLISRTIGTDRIVDEMYITFRHTQEIPWMLPGIPPTDKEVSIALVSIVTIRGKKLCHENVYWDQASVLVQLGLLDPKYVPAGFSGVVRTNGVGKSGENERINDQKLDTLPVVGAKGAWKVFDEESERSNELIRDW
ncbi:hypothetical protein AJ78_05498 [Emergomyces pasteurianus Ep9510]|uniref:SnoaL-like domain-containing protein n=1 Tax=Emergomyces pasteurianus Ep9510 TaxID=1447872 RepID=A0A1J9Q1S2_9EURO|nr:hypothetical protein AJ78_05498 [Emergomyces pasteurianus Ep9510]